MGKNQNFYIWLDSVGILQWCAIEYALVLDLILIFNLERTAIKA